MEDGYAPVQEGREVFFRKGWKGNYPVSAGGKGVGAVGCWFVHDTPPSYMYFDSDTGSGRSYQQDLRLYGELHHHRLNFYVSCQRP
jgi:hypothetical protein